MTGGLATLLMLASCSPQSLLLQRAAAELAGTGLAAEEDIGLARDAAPFYLKLSESVLQRTPGHAALAESVAAGFTQYAFAFVAFEAEKLESSDARAALRLRERAARLYARAMRHALTALEAQQPGLRQALAEGRTPPLAAEAVGLAYWAAASWGAHIALSKDRPDTVADLPQVLRLAQAAHAVAPAHGHGALATLMGQLELARPGGTPRVAVAHFDRALALGAPANAGALLAKAEGIALPAGDRANFEAWVREALRASEGQRDLSAQVMHQRAAWLLATLDDRF